jgi:hypothetical protein
LSAGGHPVFVIEKVQWAHWKEDVEISIAPQCPVLGEIGLAKLIPPEQMYQDLAYFVGNLMFNSPDIEPPVELSNKQKIHQSWFRFI